MPAAVTYSLTLIFRRGPKQDVSSMFTLVIFYAAYTEDVGTEIFVVSETLLKVLQRGPASNESCERP